MTKGLTAAEVGTEIAQHARRNDPHQSRDRLLSVSEALLLSFVALLAAWSGYAASKWSTESRVAFAEASADRRGASRAGLDALELRNFDSSTFEAWFAAFIARNKEAMTIAERRFRPPFGSLSTPGARRSPRRTRTLRGADLHAPVPAA